MAAPSPGSTRRKGWDLLSDKYRRRLERSGLTRQSYEAGASLTQARGHTSAPGIGEKSYSRVRQIAELLHWEQGTAADNIADMRAQGYSLGWIRQRLAERIEDTYTYRQDHDPLPGRAHWTRRDMIPSQAWYWYH